MKKIKFNLDSFLKIIIALLLIIAVVSVASMYYGVFIGEIKDIHF